MVRIHLAKMFLTWHLLEMIMQYSIIFNSLHSIDIFIKYWLKLFNVINVHFEVHKSVTKSSVTICQLKVKLSIL
jgi:hypothetical protein